MTNSVQELERAADLCERIDFGAGADLTAMLVEPLATYLGAETAVFRSFSIAEGVPRLDAVVPVGIPESVNDAYVSHYIELDPARRLLRQRFAKALFHHRTREGEWSNEHTSPRQLRHDREQFLRFREEFLLPNGFCHHLGFCFQAAGGRTLLFDFHRRAQSPEFGRLERARVRLVGLYLHAKAGRSERADSAQGALGVDDRLSLREAEVAEAVMSGLSNKEVAADLGISVRTVENHMRSLFAKLEVATRMQLAARLRGGHRTFS